jgi:hypothetical protein
MTEFLAATENCSGDLRIPEEKTRKKHLVCVVCENFVESRRVKSRRAVTKTQREWSGTSKIIE